MPFDKNTAAAVGRSGALSRWKDKPPGTVRNKQLKISITEAEREAIDAKAAGTGLSMAELIVRAVKSYKP